MGGGGGEGGVYSEFYGKSSCLLFHTVGNLSLLYTCRYKDCIDCDDIDDVAPSYEVCP